MKNLLQIKIDTILRASKIAKHSAVYEEAEGEDCWIKKCISPECKKHSQPI